MRATFATLRVMFSEVPFWKLLDHYYVQSSFSTITKHIDNSILKDILQLKNFTDIDQDKRLFFHQDLCKHHENKNQRRCLENYHFQKNATWYFNEHCTKIDDISLIVRAFFFSQTNLVFKSYPKFIDILDSFCHSLFTFLHIDYWYFMDFEVHSVSLRRFYENQ